MSPNKDKTGNERQQRRRQREKAWLKENGFESWEALHTALMNGTTRLIQRAADECPTCAGLGFVNDNRGRRGVDCSDCNGSGIRR